MYRRAFGEILDASRLRVSDRHPASSRARLGLLEDPGLHGELVNLHAATAVGDNGDLVEDVEDIEA